MRQAAPPPPPTDEEWGWVWDQATHSRAMKEAEARYRDFTSDQINHLRRRCKTDLFFLANGPLEYDLLSENLHGDYCLWLERTRKFRFRLTLFPRGHYKSTIKTIAEPIQMALPNIDANGAVILTDYPWTLGPDIKTLLAHENRESASRFLFEITQAFVAKPLMLALFPELIPKSRIQRMNKWELELPRSSHSKEPTFDTLGAGGAGQGRHYHRPQLDDIIGEDARDSPTIMRRIINWFDNVNSLLTRPKIDGWDLTGTHWSFEDVYRHAMEVYGIDKKVSVMNAYDPEDIEKLDDGPLAIYIRGVLENNQPIFPEEVDMEFVNRLRKNPTVYASQYANNPRKSGLTEFETHWLKFYNVSGRNIYVFAGDQTWKVNLSDLDIVILIDPSMGERDESDESGMIVTGTDAKMNVYILETVKKQLRPPDVIDEMFRLYLKWKPRVMSVEDVAFSSIYAFWFAEKCRHFNLWPSMYRYKPGTRRHKDARIRGMTHYFAAGQVIIPEMMHDFRDEYEKFPLGKGKHLLDAFAQGPEVWAPGLQQRDVDHARAAEQRINDQRDELTGY